LDRLGDLQSLGVNEGVKHFLAVCGDVTGAELPRLAELARQRAEACFRRAAALKAEARRRARRKRGTPMSTRETTAPTAAGISDEIKRRVEAATVRLTAQGGRGVLVPGGYILTATHCINWDGRGAMTLGEHFPEPVETADGRAFRAWPCAVDTVSDLAALEPFDDQVLPDDFMAFVRFSGAVPGVPLLRRTPAREKPHPVHVWTQEHEWITGRVIRDDPPGLPDGRIWLEADSPIKGGTSGSPVVDEAGLLVGVVSFANEVEAGPCSGLIPFAHLALPRWLVARITAASAESPA
jgi:S1-C subfamily serine protease